MAFVGSFICRLIVVTYRPSCFAKAKNSIERKICCLCDFPFGMLVYLAALLCNDDKVLLHSQGRYCRRARTRTRTSTRQARVGVGQRVPQGAGMLDVRHRSLSRKVAIRRVPFARSLISHSDSSHCFLLCCMSACGLLSSTTLATLTTLLYPALPPAISFASAHSFICLRTHS